MRYISCGKDLATFQLPCEIFLICGAKFAWAAFTWEVLSLNEGLKEISRKWKKIIISDDTCSKERLIQIWQTDGSTGSDEVDKCQRACWQTGRRAGVPSAHESGRRLAEWPRRNAPVLEECPRPSGEPRALRIDGTCLQQGACATPHQSQGTPPTPWPGRQAAVYKSQTLHR